MNAVALILDKVAPFNVDLIPNNYITKHLFPEKIGRSISNSVYVFIRYLTFIFPFFYKKKGLHYSICLCGYSINSYINHICCR